MLAIKKSAMMAAAVCAALAVFGQGVDAVSYTFPKCKEGAEGCCAFGAEQMASPGYLVVNLEEGATVVTCSHGNLMCARGNPALRAAEHESESVDCPDFAALTESRSGIEYLDGAIQHST